MTTQPETTETTITSAARACAQGWAEQANETTNTRWTAPVPEADLEYLEREILGRTVTAEEEAVFARIFVEEFDACMRQRLAHRPG